MAIIRFLLEDPFKEVTEMKRRFLICAILGFCSVNLYAQGSGYAIDVGSNDAFVGFCPIDFGFTDQMTVTTWVKWNTDPSTYGSDGKWANIASNNAYDVSDFGQFWLQHSSDNSEFEFAVQGANRSFVWSTTSPEQGVWYHVAGVYDATLDSDRMKIYVNGVFENGNNNVSGSITAFQETFLLKAGRWSCECGSRSLDGVIDEITVWNRALSADEIRELMSEKLSGSETGLVGYWRFDEGTSDTTTDLSPNDNHGHIFREDGIAESAASLTLTDSDKAWAVSEWQDHLIGITNGTGAGQKRQIVSNTATTLTISEAWDTTPDATSHYVVSSYDEWVTSGAPIGDASLYAYPAPSSVNLASDKGDNILVGSITGSPDGIQVYRVDSAPNDPIPPAGIAELSTVHYFGVKTTGGSPIYTVTYDYDGHPGIIDESALRLVKRDNNASSNWVDASATLDESANTLTVTGQTGTEYILGSMIGNSLPVEVLSFRATQEDDSILLSWTTGSEAGIAGFVLERDDNTGNGRQLVSSYPSDPSLEARGSGAIGTDYRFRDTEVRPPGRFRYRLSSIELSGETRIASSVELVVDAVFPGATMLQAPFPNPFRTATAISYVVPAGNTVRLQVVDMLGRPVRQLTHQHQAPGSYRVAWRGRDDAGRPLPAGVYMLVLDVAGRRQTRMVQLTR